MIEAVTRYVLGAAVKPDSETAILEGMNKLMTASILPQWNEYESIASWNVNAQRVLEASGEVNSGDKINRELKNYAVNWLSLIFI
jgi:hypothetical protein